MKSLSRIKENMTPSSQKLRAGINVCVSRDYHDADDDGMVSFVI